MYIVYSLFPSARTFTALSIDKADRDFYVKQAGNASLIASPRDADREIGVALTKES